MSDASAFPGEDVLRHRDADMAVGSKLDVLEGMGRSRTTSATKRNDYFFHVLISEACA